jgi:hypothetical protein
MYEECGIMSGLILGGLFGMILSGLAEAPRGIEWIIDGIITGLFNEPLSEVAMVGAIDSGIMGITSSLFIGIVGGVVVGTTSGVTSSLPNKLSSSVSQMNAGVSRFW